MLCYNLHQREVVSWFTVELSIGGGIIGLVVLTLLVVVAVLGYKYRRRVTAPSNRTRRRNRREAEREKIIEERGKSRLPRVNKGYNTFTQPYISSSEGGMTEYPSGNLCISHAHCKQLPHPQMGQTEISIHLVQ